MEPADSAASMGSMDASQSALDSLRTVEFRETLKGYHRDDVDEYLEKAAVEAEGLQEQLRQSGERLRQAAERISQLESALENQPVSQPVETVVGDDTLQRTLVLAQKFVDETKADAEAQAAALVAEADAKARQVTEQATAQATHIAAESEQRLKEEISRLEDSAAGSPTRSRPCPAIWRASGTAFAPPWVTSCDGSTRTCSRRRATMTPLRVDRPRTPRAPAPMAGAPHATVIQGGNRSAGGSPQVAPAPSSSGTGPSGEVTQMRPTGAAADPANPNAALPL